MGLEKQTRGEKGELRMQKKGGKDRIEISRKRGKKMEQGRSCWFAEDTKKKEKLALHRRRQNTKKEVVGKRLRKVPESKGQQETRHRGQGKF